MSDPNRWASREDARQILFGADDRPPRREIPMMGSREEDLGVEDMSYRSPRPAVVDRSLPGCGECAGLLRHDVRCSAYDPDAEPLERPVVPDAELLDEDVSTHAVAVCARPHRGVERHCAWHERLKGFVFTQGGASFRCLMEHGPDVGPPRAAVDARLQPMTSSWGYAHGSCAVQRASDQLCDRPRGHPGDHKAYDPSGSGAWLAYDDYGRVTAEGGRAARDAAAVEPVRFAGEVTVSRADLEHHPSMVDVVRADMEARSRRAHAELDALAPTIAPVSFRRRGADRRPAAASSESSPVTSSVPAGPAAAGQCGPSSGLVLGHRPGSPYAWCTLPSGHLGAHQDRDGMVWSANPQVSGLPSSVANARHDLANALGCPLGEVMPPWEELLEEVRVLRRRSERRGW